MAWMIHTSYIEGDDETTPTPVEVFGPRETTEADMARLKANTECYPFALYDDDGILYYRGRALNGSDEFDPLDDYGTPNAGAVTVKVRNPTTRKWETV